MPFSISNALIKKLPTSEQTDVETLGTKLFDSQGGLCNLCSGEMNVAAEVLQADHDVPEHEGGGTTVANLRLAHAECNKSKRNLSTAQVRPYLQLRRFVRSKNGRVKYDGLTEHFKIHPAPSKVSLEEFEVSINFANGFSTVAPLYTDSVDGKDVEYAFVQVPRVALFNDAEVQPRNVRYDHAFMIYQDLLKNPLHEPPSCRLGEKDASGLQQLLMFDGQHKTIASWMLNREHVVVKLYVNMSVAQANFLVNSIQSKIKKLPLSAFEVAAKMSDEWQNKVDRYEDECTKSNTTPSEDGFLKWVPAGQERTRARAAFKAALMQRVLDHANFHLRDYVDGKDATGDLTENMVKSKILDAMLSASPLTLSFYDSTNRREEEVDNIVWMWNLVVDELAMPASGSGQNPEVLAEARRRLFKQESLQHVSLLLGQLFRQHMYRGDEPMLYGTPNPDQRKLIEFGIKNLCAHPVWTASLERDAKMLEIKEALSKNQGGKAAFEAVALKLSYLLLGKNDTEYLKYWEPGNAH